MTQGLGNDIANMFGCLVITVAVLLVALAVFAGMAFGWWDGCPDVLTMCVRGAP